MRRLNRNEPNRQWLRKLLFTGAITGAACLVAVSGGTVMADSEWANWRGPNFSGASLDAKPPAQWGQDKNIEWKVSLEGLGSSTPIVWGNQVIVHTAIEKPVEENANSDAEPSESAAPAEADKSLGRIDGNPSPSSENSVGASLQDPSRNVPPPFGRRRGPAKSEKEHQFIVTSYDLQTGNKNWQTIVKEEVPHEAGHNTNNFASASPITNGKNIYSFFGSRGLFCLDMQGNQIWEADMGQQLTRNEFGEGSSAALHKDRVIVQWDHEGDSFIAALDAANGDLKWKTARDERTTWCTPVVVEHNGVDQVIANGRKIRSYDLATGELIWSCGQLTENPIPTPIPYKDLVIATTGFRGAACYAVSLDSKDYLLETSESIKWTYHSNTPYVPSPVLYDDQLYFLSENKAILSSLNVTTGKPVFARKRLTGVDTIYASLGAADGKIYVVGRNGVTVVLEAGACELISTNELGEEIDASPVFVGDRLLLRSNKHLYSIREAGAGEAN